MRIFTLLLILSDLFMQIFFKFNLHMKHTLLNIVLKRIIQIIPKYKIIQLLIDNNIKRRLFVNNRMYVIIKARKLYEVKLANYAQNK